MSLGKPIIFETEEQLLDFIEWKYNRLIDKRKSIGERKLYSIVINGEWEDMFLEKIVAFYKYLVEKGWRYSYPSEIEVDMDEFQRFYNEQKECNKQEPYKPGDAHMYKQDKRTRENG